MKIRIFYRILILFVNLRRIITNYGNDVTGSDRGQALGQKYKDQPIPDGILEILQDKIKEINEVGKLHIQLVTEEPKAYKGIMAYGSFSG
jgi:hypothetical protein